MLDRMVFDVARHIIVQGGAPIAVTELDPFTQAGITYLDDDIQIFWFKQIAATGAGQVVTIERIIVQLAPDEGWDDEEDELVIPSAVVFDSFRSDGGGGCYRYDPGPWLAHLNEVHKEYTEEEV